MRPWLRFLRRLLGRPATTPDNALAAPPRADKTVPPRPADWTLTIDDLFAEMKAGKRKTLANPELQWARDYARSLIPEGMRFPRAGDVYAAREDMEVEYLTAWAAPYTGGGKGWLKRGEQVVVKTTPGEERPLGAYAEAEDYATLEARMVPAAERSAGKYGGFYFWFRTEELNTRFELVSSREPA